MLGPAGGAAAGRLAGNWIDRGNPFQFRGIDPSAVIPERIDMPGGRVQPNLGFGGVNLPGYSGSDARGYAGGLSPMPLPSAPYMGQSAFDSNGNTINDRMNAWGNGTPTAPSRRGSSTLAEGEAAQDYVANMQLGNWLGMRAARGPGTPVNRQS